MTALEVVALLHRLVDTAEERAEAYKILKNFAKLSPTARQAIVAAMKEVAGNSLCLSLENVELSEDTMNVLEISIDLAKQPRERAIGEAALGIILLLISLCAAIFNLPSFLLLEAKSIYLRIAWRYMILFLIFMPKLVFDAYNNVFLFVESVTTYSGQVFGLALLNTVYVYLVYYAVQHTFVVHTLLLCSIATTFNATWKIASKQPFTRLEYVGIGVNVFGAYLCCCEGAPLASNKDERFIGSDILIGNFCAIFSSALCAIYNAYSSEALVERKCPLSVYFGLLSLYTIVISYILAQVLGEDVELLSFNPTVGFFGLFSNQ